MADGYCMAAEQRVGEQCGQGCGHGAVLLQGCSGQRVPKKELQSVLPGYSGGARWVLSHLPPEPGSLPTAVAQRLNRPNWIFSVAKTAVILSCVFN